MQICTYSFDQIPSTYELVLTRFSRQFGDRIIFRTENPIKIHGHEVDQHLKNMNLLWKCDIKTSSYWLLVYS